MILREKFDTGFGTPFSEDHRDSVSVERITYDGDIGRSDMIGECRVETCADGGFKLIVDREDEFGFESTT